MVRRNFLRRIKSQKDNVGFTFVEMIMTVAMISILALFLPRFFQQANQAAMSATDESIMLQNAMVTQYNLTRFLRTAKASTVQISQLPTNAPFSQIQFTSISGDQIQIAQSGTDLLVTKNGVQSKLVTSAIKGVSFIYPNPSDLQLIQYAMTIRNKKGTLSYSFGTKYVRLDNL